jgi:phage gp29-like protein
MSTQTQIASVPPQGIAVTRQILLLAGLNAQAFSGQLNPSQIYRRLVAGGPDIFPLLREIEEKDTAIASALAIRKMLVMARAMTVESADPENGTARLYADSLSEFLDAIPRWRAALWELLDAPAYGYAVSEIIWKIQPEGIRAELIGRPQELFRFGATGNPQDGELLLSAFPGGEGIPVPEEKFIVNTWLPRHGDRRGQPLLRRLFWASWFKRNALRLHLKFLEKGRGTIVVKYNPSASEEEKNKALEAAQAIAEEAFAAVPAGFELIDQALQSTRTHDGNDFRELFSYFDAEMTRIILGQRMTTAGTEQGAGSRAVAEVHQNLQDEIVRSDALDLEEAVNEQLCRPWLLWTFGPKALLREFRPWWRIDKDPPEDVNQNLNVLLKAQNLGLQIPLQQAYEKAQLRPPEQGEEVLPRQFSPADLFGPASVQE